MRHGYGVTSGAERYATASVRRQRSWISKLRAEARTRPRVGGNERRTSVRHGDSIACRCKSYAVALLGRQRSWIGKLSAKAADAPRVRGNVRRISVSHGYGVTSGAERYATATGGSRQCNWVGEFCAEAAEAADAPRVCCDEGCCGICYGNSFRRCGKSRLVKIISHPFCCCNFNRHKSVIRRNGHRPGSA